MGSAIEKHFTNYPELKLNGSLIPAMMQTLRKVFD